MGCRVFLQVFLVELFCGEIWEHFGLVLWPVWGYPGLPFREFLSRSTQPEYVNLTSTRSLVHYCGSFQFLNP